MLNREQIQNGMQVFARDQHTLLGSVDHLDGEEFIKLRKSDSPDGKHRWIPVEWAQSVKDGALILNKAEDEFEAGAVDESPLDAEIVDEDEDDRNRSAIL